MLPSRVCLCCKAMCLSARLSRVHVGCLSLRLLLTRTACQPFPFSLFVCVEWQSSPLFQHTHRTHKHGTKTGEATGMRCALHCSAAADALANQRNEWTANGLSGGRSAGRSSPTLLDDAPSRLPSRCALALHPGDAGNAPCTVRGSVRRTSRMHSATQPRRPPPRCCVPIAHPLPSPFPSATRARSRAIHAAHRHCDPTRRDGDYPNSSSDCTPRSSVRH